MSGISRETVAEVAQLARIDLEATELDRYTEQLDTVLRTIEEDVQQADVTNVEPTYIPVTQTNVFREDSVTWSLTNEQAVSQAPDAEDGQYKVPAILEAE